jgi:tetratricopeptide (TPR) repeat protein
MLDGTYELVEEAMEECRQGHFARARRRFEQVAQGLGKPSALPARALAWYGLALAASEKNQTAAGLSFCRAALRKDPVDGDLYYALARIYLLGDSRKLAVQAVTDGLRAEPSNEALRALRRELGVRARPVIPFLPRENPLNRVAGQLLRRKPRSEAAQRGR